VFVNEGQLADVYTPGTYTLTTENMPILATLKGWKYGFNSPFKAEVYFVVTRQFTDLKWGTQNPVMRRDPEFGPIRLRAFGTYAMRVADPGVLVKQVSGTNATFTEEGITDQLRNVIVARFTDTLGESKIPMLDLAGNLNELGEFVANVIRPEFAGYGLELMKLLIENISLPPAVEEALDKRSSMGIVGNLQQYMQFQAANAMEAAAKNPGGAAGGGMGMGMGLVMAGNVGGAMSAAGQSGPAGGPPPLPGQVSFFVGVNGQQTGPFDAQTLGEQIKSGRVTRQTLVWKQGMAGWGAAGEQPELAGQFASVPPPMPS
jgi:membrane protease subunit (stomatin/prohibitin family)